MATRSRASVRRIATARLISAVGGAAAYLALNFTIYQRTHSAAWLAAALFLTFGTVGFASPFASALGDRFDRRRVMIVSDLAGAACFSAMAFIRSPVPLLAVAFCSALAEAPFLSASSAAIPNLVGAEDIAWANGMVALGRNAGIVLGPLAGGVLVSTVGAGAVFAANAVSFAVSASLVSTVHGRFNEDRAGRSEHHGLRAGFRFLLADRILRAISLAYLAIVLGLGMTMVADVPLVALFKAGSFGYGVLIACWGGGSIVGSLLGRYLKGRTEPAALVIGTAVVSGTSVATGVSPWFALALGAIFAMGVGDGVSLVAQQGIFQRRTPDAVRSRVSGAFDAVVLVGLACSYVIAGPAVSALGARGVYVVGGIAAFVGVTLAVPVVRSARATGQAPVPSEVTEPASLLVP